jgi:hypothetical protein
MKPRYEVIYGGLGAGKSTYAVKNLIEIPDTFKLGVGNFFSEMLILGFGAVKIHEQENRELGLAFKGTTLKNINEDIRNVDYPTLMIDDWSTLARYALFYPENLINTKITNIFESINSNKNLERCLFVSTDSQTYIPFRLHKKISLWNKRLFREADKITRIDYGIPILIK